MCTFLRVRAWRTIWFWVHHCHTTPTSRTDSSRPLPSDVCRRQQQINHKSATATVEKTQLIYISYWRWRLERCIVILINFDSFRLNEPHTNELAHTKCVPMTWNVHVDDRCRMHAISAAKTFIRRFMLRVHYEFVMITMHFSAPMEISSTRMLRSDSDTNSSHSKRRCPINVAHARGRI